MSVSVNYCGGLGNQLFGIYAGMAYALENSKPFVVTKRDTSPGCTHRVTYFSSLLKHLPTVDHDPVSRSSIQEGTIFSYSPLPSREGNVVLNGYFQDHRYFASRLEEINQYLRIPEQRNEVLQRVTRPNGPTIGLHFRLGDYKRLQHYHPLLPNEYYVKALQDIHLALNGTVPTILVFCETEDAGEVESRVKQLLSFDEQWAARYQMMTHHDDVTQLFLMSACDYLVIANSTFSWWAAAYASSDTQVFVPHKWFHTPTPDGLVLKGWKKIEW